MKKGVWELKSLILIRHGEAEHLVGDGESRLTGGMD